MNFPDQNLKNNEQLKPRNIMNEILWIYGTSSRKPTGGGGGGGGGGCGGEPRLQQEPVGHVILVWN